MSARKSIETLATAALFITSETMTSEQISESIGLRPMADRKRLSGFDPEMVHPTSKANVFRFEVRHRVTEKFPDSTCEALRTAIEDLLGKVEPLADRLDQIRPKTSVQIMCVYASGQTPDWVILSDTLLQRLAALKVTFFVWVTSLKGKQER